MFLIKDDKGQGGMFCSDCDLYLILQVVLYTQCQQYVTFTIKENSVIRVKRSIQTEVEL